MFRGQYYHIVYCNCELKQEFVLNHLRDIFDKKKRKIQEYIIITINKNIHAYFKLDKSYHVLNIKFFDIDKYHPIISISRAKSYISHYIKSCTHITNINFNKDISA